MNNLTRSRRPKCRFIKRQSTVCRLAVESLDADLDLDATDAHESRLEMRASTIDYGVVALDSARFDAHGRTDRHDLALEFQSQGDEARRLPAFRGRIGVSGAYEPARRTWLGRLDETAATFPDGSATLLQPAAIEASPAVVRVAPICLQSGDARLCAEGERHASPASWRVLYSAQDWPLKRLLRSMLGWKEFDGRLQAADAKAEPIVLAARQEVVRILKEHRPPELDKTVQQDIKAVLAQNDIEFHGKPIPTKYLDRKM